MTDLPSLSSHDAFSVNSSNSAILKSAEHPRLAKLSERFVKASFLLPFSLSKREISRGFSSRWIPRKRTISYPVMEVFSGSALTPQVGTGTGIRRLIYPRRYSHRATIFPGFFLRGKVNSSAGSRPVSLRKTVLTVH